MNLFELFAKLTLDSKEYEKGLEDAEKSADNFKDKWSKVGPSIGKGLKNVGAGLGVFTAMGAGAFKAADGVSKNLDEIDKMSQKLGLSAKAYQEWDYVLKISGTEMSNMSMGLKTLTNKFDDAINGSDSAIETFNKLGLSMEDIQGLSREDLFGTVINQFQQMEDSAERAALANDLFGRSGQELAPLFNTTAEETQSLIKQVNELGGVMSDDAVKDGAKFQDSLTSLKTAFSGAGNSLAKELLPFITSLMDKISQFIAGGGLKNFIELLKNLAPVIALVVAGFAGFKIISGVISLVQGLSTAFGILNTVMAANPIGLVVIAIVGLIAAFVALWNKCDAFRQFFIDMWEGIKKAFSAVVDFFGKAFKSISGFAAQAWNAITEAFAAVGEWFNEHVVQPVVNFFANMWNGLTEGAAQAWEGIKNAFGAVSDWFKDVFSKAWEAVKNVFSTGGKIFTGIKDGILSAFKTVVNAIIKGINKVISIPFKGINAALEGIKNVNILGLKPFDWINTIPIPQIPELARGGILKKGQMGFLEGDGAEAVVPLDQNKAWVSSIAEALKESLSGNPATSGATYIINVNQPVSTPADMMRAIRTESQYGLIRGESLA